MNKHIVFSLLLTAGTAAHGMEQRAQPLTAKDYYRVAKFVYSLAKKIEDDERSRNEQQTSRTKKDAEEQPRKSKL